MTARRAILTALRSIPFAVLAVLFTDAVHRSGWKVALTLATVGVALFVVAPATARELAAIRKGSDRGGES